VLVAVGAVPLPWSTGWNEPCVSPWGENFLGGLSWLLVRVGSVHPFPPLLLHRHRPCPHPPLGSPSFPRLWVGFILNKIKPKKPERLKLKLFLFFSLSATVQLIMLVAGWILFRRRRLHAHVGAPLPPPPGHGLLNPFYLGENVAALTF